MFSVSAKKESARHAARIREYLEAYWVPSLEAEPPKAAKMFAMQPTRDSQKARRGRAREEAPCESAGASVAGGIPDMPLQEPVDSIKAEGSLEEYLSQVQDESFTQMLFRKIDEKGLKDAECYKKANIDKRLFSKIRSNPSYKPSKSTALALALALELPLDEAAEMLCKAGYSFSHASKADLIVEYYIRNGIYDILVINQSLYEFDQPIIGNFN